MDAGRFGRDAVVRRGRNEVVVYAEGGGDSDQLRSELRQAFAGFFDKTELQTCKPRVIACGSREHAFRDFRLAINQGANALLLVDSEAPVIDAHQPPSGSRFQPWAHLKSRDNWDRPDKASDEDCHLMVQCMESWLVADWETVSGFFAQGFKSNEKPSQPTEKIPKDALFNALEKATKDCQKRKYGKGSHSFKLLALILPERVRKASPWAKRFIDEIVKRKSIP